MLLNNDIKLETFGCQDVSYATKTAYEFHDSVVIFCSPEVCHETKRWPTAYYMLDYINAKYNDTTMNALRHTDTKMNELRDMLFISKKDIPKIKSKFCVELVSI